MNHDFTFYFFFPSFSHREKTQINAAVFVTACLCSPVLSRPCSLRGFPQYRQYCRPESVLTALTQSSPPPWPRAGDKQQQQQRRRQSFIFILTPLVQLLVFRISGDEVKHLGFNFPAVQTLSDSVQAAVFSVPERCNFIKTVRVGVDGGSKSLDFREIPGKTDSVFRTL